MRISQRATILFLALMTAFGGFLTLGTRHGLAAATGKAGSTQNLTITEEEPVAGSAQGALLYLGIQTQAADSRSAQSDAQQALDRLRQGLRAAGVPTSAVQVTGYRIGASSRTPGAGATVWQNLQIQIQSQDKLGQAIDAAVASGATVVQGTLGQGPVPTAEQRATAVQSAVRSARSDARAIAGALGERLGQATAVDVRLVPGSTSSGRYVMQVRVTFGG